MRHSLIKLQISLGLFFWAQFVTTFRVFKKIFFEYVFGHCFSVKLKQWVSRPLALTDYHLRPALFGCASAVMSESNYPPTHSLNSPTLIGPSTSFSSCLLPVLRLSLSGIFVYFPQFDYSISSSLSFLVYLHNHSNHAHVWSGSQLFLPCFSCVMIWKRAMKIPAPVLMFPTICARFKYVPVSNSSFGPSSSTVNLDFLNPPFLMIQGLIKTWLQRHFL